MNTILKFKQTDNQKIYWISDTHLNHNKDFVYAARGHSSSREHTDFIINKINEFVRPNDILFHAGDFCLNTDESGLNELLARIQCQNIYLLWGNHPNPLWKIYKKEISQWLQYNLVGHNSGGTTHIDDIKPEIYPNWPQHNDAGYNSGGTIHVNDIEPEIYPFRYKNIVFIGDYAEVTVDGRYFVLSHYPLHSWNSMKNGSIHLFGHLHCSNSPDNGKRMDIGWDKIQRPYSTEEIIEIMNKKPVVSDGGHH